MFLLSSRHHHLHSAKTFRGKLRTIIGAFWSVSSRSQSPFHKTLDTSRPEQEEPLLPGSILPLLGSLWIHQILLPLRALVAVFDQRIEDTGLLGILGSKRPATPKMKWRSPFKLPKVLLGLTIVASLYVDVSANEGNWTEKHEAGRCAIRGQCGKKSFFGGELPCPDNGKAEAPDEDTRKKLVAICGDGWDDGNVCCDSAQVRSCWDQADFAIWTNCQPG